MSSISHSITATRIADVAALRVADDDADHIGRAIEVRDRRRHSRHDSTRIAGIGPKASRIAGQHERACRRQQLRRVALHRPARRRAGAASPAQARKHAVRGLTVPLPTLSGETTMRSALNQSRAKTAPTMSTIESSAPTSCRWTFSTGMWWMADSASASRSKSADARVLPLSDSADCAMRFLMPDR